jgi:hypothetical protein
LNFYSTHLEIDHPEWGGHALIIPELNINDQQLIEAVLGPQGDRWKATEFTAYLYHETSLIAGNLQLRGIVTLATDDAVAIRLILSENAHKHIVLSD